MKLSAAIRPREGETYPDVARRAARLGFRGVSLGFDHRWSDRDLLAIRQAFDEAGVQIVELGCYCNFITPRDEETQRNFQRLQKALEAGAVLNCDHAVTFAGSRSPDLEEPFAAHPENWADATWELLVARAWALLDAVEDLGVCLCFEPSPTTTLNSLESLTDLTADLATSRVRIALDPAAIFTPAAAQDTRHALAEIFSQLADTIAVARASDFRLVEAGPEPRMETVPVGQGLLHYGAYLQFIQALELDTPLIVKHQPTDDAYLAARDFLAAVAAQAGLRL